VTASPEATEPAAPRTPSGPPGAQPGPAPATTTSPGGREPAPPPGLADISARMRSARPVFIVGEARSGSTLLLHTLLKHPTFAPLQENLQESSFIVQAPAAAGFATSPPRNLRRFLLEDEDAWNGFLDSIRPLRPWLRAAAAAGRTLDWQWRLGPAVLVARSFAYHAWQARGCERLLEKTPDHVHHIAQLDRAFPRARLLYAYRHPVDVYSSYRRRGRVDPKAAWARIGPEEFSVRYRERTERALAAAERLPDRMLLIRYEELTGDPAGELQRICSFLGEPPHVSTMLMPDSEPDRVAHWEGTSYLFRGITTETKRWQDHCSVEEAAVVERHLADLMARLGYERRTTGSDRRTTA
jgi:hypothetical protein